METQLETHKRSIFATILSEKNVSNYTRAFIALCGVITVYMTFKINTRTDNIEQKTEINTAKIDTLHASVNGKVEKLLELTETSAKAEGVLQQKEKQDSIENK